MNIRVATVADVPTIIRMGQRFIAGTRYQRFLNFNPQKQTQLVTELVQQDTGEVFVAEAESGVCGMLGLTLSRNAIDDAFVAMELFWWVDPTRRGGITGVRLLRAGEEWAKTKGAERIYMISPEPAVGAFLERLRYDYVESLYQRPL